MASDVPGTDKSLTTNQKKFYDKAPQPEKGLDGNNHSTIDSMSTLEPITHTTPGSNRKDVISGNEKYLKPDTEIAQQKWQMASCVHFVDVFRDVLPLRDISEDTAEDLTPILLEQAIVQPEQNVTACLALRDIIMALLVALGASTLKSVSRTWFQSLSAFVDSYPVMFLDCFDGDKSLLRMFDDGLVFLVSVTWNVRLGLMLALCDIAAEESSAIRQAIRDAEQAKPQIQPPLEASQVGHVGEALSHVNDSRSATTELETRGIRLLPIGRCSRKRTFYMIGKSRIYSGYKRKGSGSLVVECSDSESMEQLATALESSQHPRDVQLAASIRGRFLQPLLKFEEEENRKRERKRLEQSEQ